MTAIKILCNVQRWPGFSPLLKSHKTCSRTLTTNAVYTQQLDETGHIAILTLNRIDKKNALSKEFALAIESNVAKIATQESNVRAVVVRSTVPGIFCAGADLKERLGMTLNEIAPMSGLLRKVFTDISRLKCPTIAAIDGHALGGGLELALACDIRVVGSNVKLGLVETNLGIIPGAGGTQRLPRIVGIARAKEMILMAKVIDGLAAASMGLVAQCIEQNSNGDAAFQKAVQMANVIASRGPIGVRAAKQAINEGMEVTLEEGLIIEGKCYDQVVPTNDRIEGLKSFVEKRPPKFTGK